MTVIMEIHPYPEDPKADRQNIIYKWIIDKEGSIKVKIKSGNDFVKKFFFIILTQSDF